MTDKPAVFDFVSLNQKTEELEAERRANIMGKPIEGEPTEAPKDIDWGMYAPCGYNIRLGYEVIAHITSDGKWIIDDEFKDFIG